MPRRVIPQLKQFSLPLVPGWTSFVWWCRTWSANNKARAFTLLTQVTCQFPWQASCQLAMVILMPIPMFSFKLLMLGKPSSRPVRRLSSLGRWFGLEEAECHVYSISSLFLRSLMFCFVWKEVLHVTYHSDMAVMMVSRLSRVGGPRVQLTELLTLSDAFPLSSFTTSPDERISPLIWYSNTVNRVPMTSHKG